MIQTVPTHGPKRSGRRFGVAALVAVVALGACTSDPGPRRVAQDIIKAEAVNNPELNEQCMLDALEGFSDSDLEAIASQLDNSNAETSDAGQAALDDYEATLAACN